MRVAWIVYGALDQTTGGYIYDRLVIERLRRGGDDVDVVSLAPRGVRGATAGIALAASLRAKPYDAVIGDELCFPELAVAFPAVARRIARVLLVHHLSSWEEARGARGMRAPATEARALAVRALEAVVLRACDARIATSGVTAARLAEEHGVHAVVAEPGADRLGRQARLRGEGGHDDGLVELVFVGTLTARKGVLELLDALERAAATPAGHGLRLTIVGDGSRDGPYAAAVRARVTGSKLLVRRVRLTGPVAEGRLAELLAEADALVLPSRFEGYGMVLTEALAQGTPVIATDAGAISTVVRDGAEALLVPTGVDAALAGAIGRFGGDVALRTRMRAFAEARSAELPTWDDTATAVREVIASAVERMA